MKRLLTVLAIFFLSAACALPALVPAVTPTPAPGAPRDLTPTFTPHPTVTPEPALATLPPETSNMVVVSLNLRDDAQYGPKVEAGTTISVEMTFQPSTVTITRKSDGRVYTTQTKNWANPSVDSMRLCFEPLGPGTPCAGPAEREPFKSTVTREVKVDWLGEREIAFSVEFFDARGTPIPAARRYDEDKASAQVQASMPFVAVVGTNVPLEKLSSPVLTALAATRTAFPVSGKVSVENGKCCAGGVAGTQVSLKVQFSASSPAGAVTEMRVRAGGGGCVSDPAQFNSKWEPFAPEKTYSAPLAINWVGWYVSVQYRDAAGNLSAVACDDISLEGSPPAPKP